MSQTFHAGSIQPFVLKHIAGRVNVGQQAIVVVPSHYAAIANPPVLTADFALVSVTPDRHQITLLRQ
jgi:hypothetical protein